MTEKQYYCDGLLEYRDYAIFDLSKADKNIDDFKDEDGSIALWQFGNYLVDETNSILTGEEVCELLNKLNDENKELKAVIEEVFEMVTTLDYVRGQYLNRLLDILGEENDVDKTKERIKEFLK